MSSLEAGDSTEELVLTMFIPSLRPLSGVFRQLLATSVVSKIDRGRLAGPGISLARQDFLLYQSGSRSTIVSDF